MPNFIYKNNIIEYTLSRNAKKNVNFRIKSDGNVYVSAPHRVSKKELEQMLYDKAEWIIKNREKIMQKQHNKIDKEIKNGNLMIINGNKYIVKIISGKINKIYFHENLLTIQIKEKYYKNNEYVNKYFDRWIRETIYYLSNQFAEKYIKKLSKYNLTKPEIIIRDMKSRWGSCIPSKNKILISKNLIYPPLRCLEYVVLHEVSHLIEPNHSKMFYKIIEDVMPDWSDRRKELNEF